MRAQARSTIVGLAPQTALEPLVTQAEVKRLVGGKSNMTIHRWIGAGVLPPPLKICGRNFWPRRVIAELLARGSGVATASDERPE